MAKTHRERIQGILSDIEHRAAKLESQFADAILDAGVASALAALRMESIRQNAKLGAVSPSALNALRQQAALIKSRSDELSAHSLHDRDRQRQQRIELFQHDVSLLLNRVLALAIGVNQLGPEDLADIVPGQKLAAYKFDFSGNVVEVVDQPFSVNDRDASIASAALELALEQGTRVSADLAKTNTSPRLKAAFDTLQHKLASGRNVIQIGMCCKTCSRLLLAEAGELSPSLFEMLRAHVETVYDALAQLQDWRQYVENIASSLDKAAVAELVRGTRALADRLGHTNGVADSVPEALNNVADWIESEDDVDQRDIVSLARTVENLWSIVVRAAVSVTKETLDEAKKAAAKAIVILMLTGATAGLTAALSKVPGAEWIETAIAYFKTVSSAER